VSDLVAIGGVYGDHRYQGVSQGWAHLRRQLLRRTLGATCPRGRLNREHRLIKRPARYLEGQALP
jgi:hypothetical protein